MIKCVKCGKEADYIYFGASFCEICYKVIIQIADKVNTKKKGKE